MDDTKRDNNKIKRGKSDVKNAVSTYLQKRNYSKIQTVTLERKRQLKNSLVESELAKPHSVSYTSYTIDPAVIDHNFGKFLTWLEDLIQNHSMCYDLEYLTGPLFCHLYIDVLRCGHTDLAAAFLKCYLPSIDKTKCDNLVADLINKFAQEEDDGGLKTMFRSHKFVLELNPESIELLKQFVLEQCHEVFLQILQAWFDIQELKDNDKGLSDEKAHKSSHEHLSKLHKLHSVASDLRREKHPLYKVHVSNVKVDISCGLIKRTCGLFIYVEHNAVRINPINGYDYLFDRLEYKQITFRKHSKRVYGLAIAPNNNFLATVSEDKSLVLHNLADTNLVQVCNGHTGPVYCVTFSSNSQYVLTGSEDTTARLWHAETAKTLRFFSGHTKAVTCVDFHPNCLYVATGSADHDIRMWSVDNGQAIRLFHAAKGTLFTIAFSPNGQILAGAGKDKKIRLWDIVSAKSNTEMQCETEPVIKLQWSKDSRELCGATRAGVLKIWKMRRSSSSSSSHHDHHHSSDRKSSNSPSMTTYKTKARVLGLEYAFGTFGCITTVPRT